MVWSLILLPLGMAALVFAVPSNRWRPWLVPLVCLGHLAVVVVALQESPPLYLPPTLGGDTEGGGHWLVLDPLAKIFLALTSVLFLSCTFYTAGYLTSPPTPPRSGEGSQSTPFPLREG